MTTRGPIELMKITGLMRDVCRLPEQWQTTGISPDEACEALARALGAGIASCPVDELRERTHRECVEIINDRVERAKLAGAPVAGRA